MSRGTGRGILMLMWHWLCVLRRRSLMAASSFNEEGCHRGRLDVLFNVC